MLPEGKAGVALVGPPADPPASDGPDVAASVEELVALVVWGELAPGNTEQAVTSTVTDAAARPKLLRLVTLRFLTNDP